VADKECLDFPFTEQEVVKAIAGMRTESSPGPNRFSVIFFKKTMGDYKSRDHENGPGF
jgi:hypothetical protein